MAWLILDEHLYREAAKAQNGTDDDACPEIAFIGCGVGRAKN